jgi:hypothetical protein
MPLPDKIQNAPELLLGLVLYYRAFLDLTSCRTAGYGTEGPIGWKDTVRWAEKYELDEEQEDDLLYLVGQMDNAYLNYKTKKLAAANKPPPKRGKR